MFAIVLAAFVATAGHGCPSAFAGGLPPTAAGTVEICYDGYALGHSADTRGPLWSAEHLTAAGVGAALDARRAGAFHPESLLPRADRAQLSDYRCAPYDRGHMTPVGDFGDAAEENDTFTLANMVPQAPELNEGLWAGIEAAVRQQAVADGELYVVTGPQFGPHPARLQGRVAVPAATWKAVYDPKTATAGAYVAANDASGRYVVRSLAALAQTLGFDPMPGAPAAAKATAGPLPAPTKGSTALPVRACPSNPAP